MFTFNDRNLAIFAIAAMVIVYIFVGKEPANSADIIEKAIIALGSLATGSIARDSKVIAGLTNKAIKKNTDPETDVPRS